MPKSLVSETQLTRDSLFVNNVADVVVGTETLLKGGIHKRATVLGLIDVSDKVTAVDSTKTDGSEHPYAILADDVDATDDDVVVEVYYTGEFNETALIFGGEDTAATHKRKLREIGIFMAKTQA
jgi:hypothetical protein